MSFTEDIPLSVTDTTHVAVLEPSCVVTVIVAQPAATPVTRPDESTVANDVLLELQLTFLFVASDGSTVAVNWVVAPTSTETRIGDTLTLVTGILTVMEEVPVKLPSSVVTVIVAEPSATPVTIPDALTVATEVSLEFQITFLLVALDGAIVEISRVVAPTPKDAEVGATVTPVTAT